jgi:hypothetical protein
MVSGEEGALASIKRLCLPILSAASTAFSTCPGTLCQVPRPTTGMSAPVLSLTIFAMGIGAGPMRGWEAKSKVFGNKGEKARGH